MPELPLPDRRKRYQTDPPDKTKLERVWKLLQEYSGIPPEEIEGHIRDIRAKAYTIFPYGCLGRFRFLDIYIATHPLYPEVLDRAINQNAVVLDCACCLGQALRQLAFDGVPATNLIGLDLRPEFIDLGYDFFKDKDKFGAEFVTGDMLVPDDPSLRAVDGKVDLIHAASFFHLFGWDDQVTVGVRMVRFFKEGAEGTTVLGRQIGYSGEGEPLSAEEFGGEGKRYHHTEGSMQKLWDVIGERTGTKWRVSATRRSFEEKMEGGEKENRTEIVFVVRGVAASEPGV